MSDHDQSPAATIRALEERRCKAMLEADLKTLDELFADELFYTHSSGARDTKAVYFEALRSGKTVYRQITRSDERIIAWDDGAAVTGRQELEVVAGGQPRQISGLYLNVWRKQDGKWRMLAFQSTPAPKA